jgi:hypothetical protein
MPPGADSNHPKTDLVYLVSHDAKLLVRWLNIEIVIPAQAGIHKAWMPDTSTRA